jgi:hypothetical protein
MIGAIIYFVYLSNNHVLHDVPMLGWLSTLIFPLVASCSGCVPVAIVIGQLALLILVGFYC